MFKLTPKEQKLLILLGFLLVLGLVLRFTLPDKGELEVIKGEETGDDFSAGFIDAAGEGSSGEGSSGENQKIIVHVAGAVVNPGVYSLEEDARLYDALEEAGGHLGEAALDLVNLAQPLLDGQQVYIPRQDYGDPADNSFPGGASSAGGKVNINTAGKSDLETLPGIGAVKAQSIINYREQDGPFRDIKELLNVSGIGDKTLESIDDLVTIY